MIVAEESIPRIFYTTGGNSHINKLQGNEGCVGKRKRCPTT